MVYRRMVISSLTELKRKKVYYTPVIGKAFYWLVQGFSVVEGESKITSFW
jgi:hypothetical protein